MASIAFCSCIKNEYPGPQGPRGPQGVPGKDGTQINTIYYDVLPSQWAKIETQKECYSYVQLEVPELTQSVINSGAVLVYILLDGYDQQLPYVKTLADDMGFLYTRVIRYDLQEPSHGLGGMITFIVEDIDFAVPVKPYTSTVKFKVVIISQI